MISKKSLGILCAAIVGIGTVAGNATAAVAQWVGSGWWPTTIFGPLPHNVGERQSVFWVNTNPLARSSSQNITSQTPHWPGTVCVGNNLPEQIVFAPTWTGSGGPDFNATDYCPQGWTLGLGGTFVYGIPDF